jgi:hypothetical protein
MPGEQSRGLRRNQQERERKGTCRTGERVAWMESGSRSRNGLNVHPRAAVGLLGHSVYPLNDERYQCAEVRFVSKLLRPRP